MERKAEITAFDVRFLAQELQAFVGGRVKKIYQQGGTFCFVLKSGKAEANLLVDAGIAYLAAARPTAGRKPSDFCMLLRKYLEGKTVRAIRQPGFERIVEIRVSDAFVAIELLRPANVILCDASGKIIMPWQRQAFKDRQLLPGVTYLHPPQVTDPMALSQADFQSLLAASQNMAVVFLAALGFGGRYAEEICFRAGIDKKKESRALTDGEAQRLFAAMHAMQNDFSPAVYDGLVVAVEMKSLAGKGRKSFASFSQAVAAYLASMPANGAEQADENERQAKLARIAQARQAKKASLAQAAGENRKKADMVMANLDTVRVILAGISKARQKGMGWDEIKRKLKQDPAQQARCIREIREHEGVVRLELDGVLVDIDITKSAEENATGMYEGMKKTKGKLQRLAAIEAQPIMPVKRAKAIVKRGKMAWYEKFRWFITSDGLVAVGGRSAQQNEMVFKKYLKENDLVFHANVQGASLVVLKTEGRPVDRAKKEAAEFAAVNSRAWTSSLGSADVYCVPGSQVSKTPPSGMYVA
ncbi:MAG: NFACT family protein, partial [Candidatus Aenigmarchaeota archaeon]|nr:NFACT family protein [Candidatus Aenigmarchaeota archaeon]